MGSHRRWSARIGPALLAGALVACGMGDTMITGVGNGGNRIYSNPVLDEVIEALAGSPVIPEVTDEMLAESFASIRRRAAEGDAEAALILFRVAEKQRRAEASPKP
jgi:hypothetical protein